MPNKVTDPRLLERLNAGPQSQIPRQLKRTARIAAEAAGALPLMAIDAGVAARNLATGSNYKSGSEMYGEALDAAGLPRPEGAIEKGVDLAGQMLLTSKMPNPTVKGAPATGFADEMGDMSGNLIRQETIDESLKAGYKIPPATAKPTVGNLVTESVSGKAQTAQAASALNQKVTNRLATRALGLPDGTQITVRMLEGLRKNAGGVYRSIGNSGTIKADDEYINGLTQISKAIDDVKQGFPDANLEAGDEISKLIDSLLQDRFPAKAAVSYMKQLRSEATKAFKGEYDPAKHALGRAKRQAAETLERLVLRHLRASGKDTLANQFDKARQTIAKTYSVEAALNEATGNVVARKVGQQLAKDKPLSGELLTIGKFAQAFPKAADEVKYSPGVSAVDAIIGGGASLATLNPAFMALPFARVGARQALLSKPMQSGLSSAPRKRLSEHLNVALPSAVLADTFKDDTSLNALIEKLNIR